MSRRDIGDGPGSSPVARWQRSRRRDRLVPARYELARTAPHDHLIDVKSGQIIEFSDPRIDAIQARLAEELGYVILSYKLQIFAMPAVRNA